MQYTQGKLGRIFVLKFDNRDAFLDELKAFARREKLKTAMLFFIGALRKGRLVAGPKKCALPPSPHWVSFQDGWEFIGLGTLFTHASDPQIHVHASLGKKLKTLTGCVRGKAEVFGMVEAVAIELKNVKADKRPDPATGLNVLRILAR